MPLLIQRPPIPGPIAQEWVSISYVRALCAQAGLNISSWEWDDGLDLTIGASKRGFAGVPIKNIKFHLQVKSTSDWRVRGGKISYWLKREKYNDLVAKSADPQYLVLYTMPDDRTHWIKAENGHTMLKHAAYYVGFYRQKPVETGAGVTIDLPVTNRLTAGELIYMYRQAYEQWNSRR